MTAFPYPGLRPFERHETDIFFGREEHTDQLLNYLTHTHFIAVVGPSGCGKSSLVKTGLLAGLEAGFSGQPGIDWRIAELRPGNAPFERLAEACLAAQVLGPDYAAQFSTPLEAINFLAAALRRGPLSLSELLKLYPLPAQTRLLLVVDQFEELFRYYSQHSQALDESAAFVDWLLTSRQLPNIDIVLTLRSDFLGECALFHQLPEAISQGLFLTPRLTRAQLQSAIENPIKVVSGHIEPALVNTLLNDVGNDPDQLPVLQHVLMRLWLLANTHPTPQITLTLAHYREIGGFSQALSQHADEAYRELSPEQQNIAKILFRNLTQRAPNHLDTRRPVRLGEVAELAQVPWQAVASVVNAFRREDRSFLMPPIQRVLSADTMLDISHESLIRQWQRLKKWSEQEAEFAEFYQRLEHSARLWKEGKAALWRTPELELALAWRSRAHPTSAWARRYGQHFELTVQFLTASEEAQRLEQQRAKRERLRELERVRKQVLWAVFGLLMASGLAVWGYWERHRALLAKQDAVVAQQQAEVSARQAKISAQQALDGKQQAELAKQDAIAAQKRAEEEGRRAQKLEQQALQAKQQVEQLQQVAISAQQRAEKLFDFHVGNAIERTRMEDYALARTELENSHALDAEITPFQKSSRDWLDWFNRLMTDHEPIPIKHAHKISLSTVASSPDGQWLAVGSNGSSKQSILLFKMGSGELSQVLEHPHVQALIFDPQGRWLISGGDDQRIIFWELPSGRQLKVWKTEGKINALAINPQGELLAGAGSTHDISLWELGNLERPNVRILKGHTGAISTDGLAFSPSGEWLASAAYDQTARIWQVDTGELHTILQADPSSGKLLGITFSPDGRHVATSHVDNHIRLWEVETGQLWQVLKGHRDKVWGLRFIPNTNYLVSGSSDKDLRIWDCESGVTLRILQGHRVGISNLTVQGEQIFSVSSRAEILRWSLQLPGQQLLTLPNLATAMAIDPEGQQMVVGFAQGDLALYQLPNLELKGEVKQAHQAAIQQLTLDTTGTWLASLGADHVGQLWSVEPGRLRHLQTLNDLGADTTTVALSPEAQFFAIGDEGGQVYLYEKGNSQVFQAHLGKITALQFDRAGLSLASAGNKGPIKLWDLTSTPPRLEQEFTMNPREIVQGIAWTQEGQQLALFGQQGILSESNENLKPFSPNMSWLPTAKREVDWESILLRKEQPFIGVYSRQDGKRQFSLELDQRVLKTVFSPDNQQVIILEQTGELKFWDMVRGEILFSLRLPQPDKSPLTGELAWSCVSTQKICWLAVPLADKRMVVYQIDANQSLVSN